MKNIIFIGGINGTGKSTIGNKLSKITGIPFFEGSKVLMQELHIEEGDYYRLRQIPEKIKRKKFIMAIEKLSNDNKYLILSSHYIKVLNSKISEYSGNWFKHCILNIHVVCAPNVTFNRIKRDEKNFERYRSLFSGENKQNKQNFLEKSQVFSLKIFKKVSLRFGIRSVIIDNTAKNMAKNIEPTVTLIKNSTDMLIKK